LPKALKASYMLLQAPSGLVVEKTSGYYYVILTFNLGYVRVWDCIGFDFIAFTAWSQWGYL
jgi:hypothetical protein